MTRADLIAALREAREGSQDRVGGASDNNQSPPRDREKDGGTGGDGGGGEIDPIIRGLLARLPKSGNVWPEAERKLWLGILENAFKLIYKNAGDTVTVPIGNPGDAA